MGREDKSFLFSKGSIFLFTVLVLVASTISLGASLPEWTCDPALKGPCRGDFDEDGDVDGRDLLFLADHLACASPTCESIGGDVECVNAGIECPTDFDCDGRVGAPELRFFGSSLGRIGCPLHIEYKTFGLNFSPFIDGQDPNVNSDVSEYQIRCRMRVISRHTEWIRTFGATHGMEKAASIARELGLKVAMGAWLSRDMTANEAEIQNLIAAAQTGDVNIAIIGSEVLLRGDLTPEQLIGYIQRFKSEVPGVPATTADVYSELLGHPNVMDNCDVIFANYYPYWEGRPVDGAVAYIHALHQEMIARAGGKEVFVSESGWPSDGNVIGGAEPSMENACYFFMNFASWARSNEIKYFYFEAFDESWKAAYEGPQGAHWGLWDKEGFLKPCAQCVFDGQTIPDNWTCREIPGGPGEPAIEFTYVPPYGSFDDLWGRVWHVEPADHRVAVYIKVGSGWWTKPYFNQPLTRINCDGTWVCDITTGGVDQRATRIMAYLLPSGYDPPLVGGQSSLPSELDEHALTRIEAVRSP